MLADSAASIAAKLDRVADYNRELSFVRYIHARVGGDR
jgi:hypothetical protein